MCLCSTCSEGCKPSSTRNNKLALSGSSNDGPRDGMLTFLLHGGSKGERLLFTYLGDRLYLDHALASRGQRSRLVKDDDGKQACLLKGQTVTHQNPISG